MNILAFNLPPGVRVVDDRKYAHLVLNKNVEGYCLRQIMHKLLAVQCSKYETLEDILFLLQAILEISLLFPSAQIRSQLLASRLDVACFEVYTQLRWVNHCQCYRWRFKR